MRETMQQAELSTEVLESFFRFLESSRRSEGTRDLYERSVRILTNFLPDGRTLDRASLIRWKEDMIRKGYARRTVNSRISAINSLLKFMDRKDLQISPVPLPESEVQPELTRAEYLRLLKAAKLKKSERTYFIIKTICCGGVHVQEIPELTLEAVKTDILPGGRKGSRKLHLPEILKKELAAYAERQGIRSGTLFTTRSGTPISRTNINNSIKRLCRDARVPEEKCNSQCLLKLRKHTYGEIERGISDLIEQAYGRILEQEEAAAGWE